MGDTVALPSGRLEVEQRPGYLFVVEHGTLRSVEEVDQYGAALELLVARTGVRRALIDSRSADEVEAPEDVRDAMWRWLLGGRAFDQVAFVLANEMAVVRVNMVARSHRAGICAFGAVHEAHRWLSGRQRTLSQSFSAPLGASPTPIPPPRAPGADTSPPDGARRSVGPPPPTGRVSDVVPSRDPGAPIAPPRRSAQSTGRFPAQRAGQYSVRQPSTEPARPPSEPPARRKLDEP